MTLTFNKDTVAAVSATYLALYGGFFFLAPHHARKLYASAATLKDEKSPLVLDFLVLREALVLVMIPGLWYLHVMAGLSRDHATGLVSLGAILVSLQSLLNDTPRKLGMTSRAELSVLAVLIPAAICTLSESANRFADIAVKCLWGWTLANGLLFYIYPSAIDAVYQTPQREELVLLARRNYGAKLISYALFGGAFSMNRDATEAVGSFWASWLILSLLEVPSFKKMGLLVYLLYPMLALMAFFATTLLA